MTNQHEPLTAAEGALLRELRSGFAPRPELEDRTLERVRDEGLLTSEATRAKRSRRDAWSSLPWVAAAAILAFVLGYFANEPGGGETGGGEELGPRTGRTFLLLLHQEPGAAVDPRENARRVREYTEWAVALGERLVGGAELHDGGRRFLAPGSGLGAPLDPESSAEFVAGYFLIRVESEEEAGEVAATCPHLLYEGWIELREVVVSDVR